MKLLCATGNNVKFNIGKHACTKFDIELEQVVITIDEIQGEDTEVVVKRKAADAFDQLQQPVVVSDDAWFFAGLNGFPGPYMKSINYWFAPKDFIRLMKGVPDRQVILQQNIAYCDGRETVVFSHDIPGTALDAPRGEFGPPIMKVVSLDGDDDRSIAEMFDQGAAKASARVARNSKAWERFAAWFSEQQP